MPRSSTVSLQYAKSARDPVSLGFAARRHAGKQAAVRDRVLLQPEIDLQKYAFSAVIDWIEVEVSLGRITQFRHIQDFLATARPRRHHIVPIQPGAGKESDNFTVRIQEPRSAAAVADVCDTIAAKFGSRSTPIIREIEISIDARPKVPNDDDRARMFGVLQRTIFTGRDIFTEGNSRPRYCIAKEDPIFLLKGSKKKSKLVNTMLWPESEVPAPVDGTFYLGARDEPSLVRIMDKVVDTQNHDEDTKVDLNDDEKRVRIEVALQLEELLDLGVCELEDLRSFSYPRLQRRNFQFKLPTFDETGGLGKAALKLVRVLKEERRLKRFLSTGVIGMLAMQRGEADFRSRHLPDLQRHMRQRGLKMKRNRRGTGPAGTFVAYEELNRLVADALWNLSKRERRAWERRDHGKGVGKEKRAK